MSVLDNGYSLGQVLRFASQNNTNVLVNHYLGNISTIDGAGSFLGMELRTDLAEDFRSASAGRNPNLRFSLSTEAAEELRNSPEHILLTKNISEVNVEIEAQISPEIRAQLEVQRKAAYKERRLLESTKLKELQASQKIIYDIEREDYEQNNWRQGHFSRIIHVLPEERLRLADTLQLKASPRSPEWISALRDLISLRTNDHSVVYQEELRPIRGRCQVSSCSRELER